MSFSGRKLINVLVCLVFLNIFKLHCVCYQIIWEISFLFRLSLSSEASPMALLVFSCVDVGLL